VNFLPAEKVCDEFDYANPFRREKEELILLTPPGDQLDVIIDSGCSRHVCGSAFEEYLYEWREGPEVMVRVADGNPHTSKKYGTFRAQVVTAKGPRQITIKDVLYVEAIRSMLVSVSMLCSNGYTIDFHGNQCILHDPQGQTLKVMKKAHEQLFKLPLMSTNSQKNSRKYDNRKDMDYKLPNMVKDGFIVSVTKLTSENIQRWHNSLGHPGINVMATLSKNGKIPDFRKSDIADVISRCVACNMAKARALPAPEISANRATKVMEQIHCDAVTGLPATMNGKTGFSLIVNEFS